MKKALLFLVTFISLSFPASAQEKGKIVAFHPSAGMLIDRAEKQKYNIFSEYADSLFLSAQLIRYDSSTYAILIKTADDHSFEKSAGTKELDAIYNSIERISPANTYVDDPVEQSKTIAAEEERRKKARRAEIWANIGEASAQTFLIFLEVSLEILDAMY